MTSDPVCGFDGMEQRPHQEAEEAGTISHQFSPEGQLRPVAKKKPQRPQRVVATADPVVRLILLRKGLCTQEELAEAEVELYGRQQVPERPQA